MILRESRAAPRERFTLAASATCSDCSRRIVYINSCFREINLGEREPRVGENGSVSHKPGTLPRFVPNLNFNAGAMIQQQTGRKNEPGPLPMTVN